ncbi:MAG: hypothetical protein KGN98_07390, partial [Alphaproteobacteria bacterium]|nr:hypothetical protein [Alphaproteobacteria bacterium]
MTGGSKIVGIRSKQGAESGSKARGKSAASRASQPMAEMIETDDAPQRNRGLMLANIVAIFAALAWTVTASLPFITAAQISGADLSAISNFIATLAPPLALIALLWALYARSS